MQSEAKVIDYLLSNNKEFKKLYKKMAGEVLSNKKAKKWAERNFKVFVSCMVTFCISFCTIALEWFDVIGLYSFLDLILSVTTFLALFVSLHFVSNGDYLCDNSLRSYGKSINKMSDEVAFINAYRLKVLNSGRALCSYDYHLMIKARSFIQHNTEIALANSV